jgi:A/G-specific adenine glycosylase
MNPRAKQVRQKIDADLRQTFRTLLLDWFDLAQRDLPWRQNPTPYRVAVSEFMLQQTQVATVIPYFQRWLTRFPSWQALAQADETTVLKQWEGLGYYRRAKLLHRLAQTVITLPAQELPNNLETLKTLPGIGPYTAGAITTIAFNQPAPAVDGNVERVLARLFNYRGNISQPSAKKRIFQWASALVTAERPGDYTQALMELGALICTPSSPSCLLCPVKTLCQAESPSRLPIKDKIKITPQSETLAWIENSGNVILQKPGQGPRWIDFWQLPPFDPNVMTALEQPPPITHRYSITRYRVTATLQPAQVHASLPSHLASVSKADILHLTLPAPHRHLLTTITQKPQKTD